MDFPTRRHDDELRAPRGVRAWLAGLLLAGAFQAAPAAAAVNIDNLRDMDFGTWAPGSGTALVTQEFCVQSDFFGFIPLDWAARMDDLSGASVGSDFRIASVDGSDSVIVDVRFVDLRSGASSILEPGVATDAVQTGDTRNCPRGLNGRLELRIDPAQLASGHAGRYEGRFRFSAARFGSDADDFSVSIELPDLVRISDLDDIDLGRYPGAGDLVGSDGLCVYRNDPTTRYSIEARGDGAGSAFELQRGAERLPFEVEYDDGSGYRTLSAGAAGVDATGADPDSQSCGGAANAQVRVRVREADLATADNGAYTGALTLTVAPI